MQTVELSALATDDSGSAQQIAIRDPLGDSEWDTDIKACPQASFYHSSAWSRILHECYGYTPFYLYMGSPRRPRAVLPTMEVRSFLTGRRGVSLPFSDDCEPACADAAAYLDLFRRAQQLGRERGWRYLECRGLEGSIPAASTSVGYYGHRVALSTTEDKLFGSFDSAVRRAIRKAERSQLQVELSVSEKAVREFYGLFCLTRRRHGLPPQPFAFYESIRRHALEPGLGLIVLVRHQGKAVAGALFLHRAQTAIMKFAASDEHFLHFRINNLALWEAMKHYAQAGFQTMDLGRTSLWNNGLRGYKRRWGANEHRIDYQRFDLRRNAFIRSEDRTSGAQVMLFQHLPLSISRLAGTLLYRHVA